MTQIPINGLMAYYPFNGNPNDSSGFGLHGFDYGASKYSTGKCYLARDYYNSPSTTNNFDYTTIPNVINSSEFTICFWTKIKSTGTHQCFLYLSEGYNWVFANLMLFTSIENKLTAIVNGLDLRTIDYSHNALVNGEYNNSFIKSEVLQWDQYYFVTCTFKNNVFTYFLNGEKYSQFFNVNTVIGTPSTNILLGICPKMSPSAMLYFMDGTLDRLCFYNRVLTDDEIRSFYTSDCSFPQYSTATINGFTEVCQGQRNVAFDAINMDNKVNYTWTYSGNGASIQTGGDNIVIDFDNYATSGELKVIGYNSGGIESDTATLNITVESLPTVANNIFGQHEVCYNQNGVNYYTVGIIDVTNYIWEYSGKGVTIFGSSEDVQISFYENATNGDLTVKGINGCGIGNPSEPFPISIKFCDPGQTGNLNIPNSFSPNGDGINEVFYIRGLPENSILLIFDRAGKKIYESTNYLNNWDGKNSEGLHLESGTYWFTLIIPGLPTEFKGYVYLKN